MLTFFVIVPILIAVFLYLFPFKTAGRITSIFIQIGFTVATTSLFAATRNGEIVTVIGGYGQLGITLRADLLSSVFILLTAFIFLCAAIYSYNNDKSKLFWFLFFIWEASIIGIFLSGDLFNIFVLTEVGTVVVSVLIMYNRKERSMYDGMVYLMINVVVIQFYLLGLAYVYRLTGALDMAAVTYGLAAIEPSQQLLPYALIITFVALKCAVLPVFSWLPKAHGTPGASAAVSAVLSGLHIKSGLYLFLRFQEVFGEVALAELFLVVGLATSVVGIVMSLAQTDIKLLLAYSTVAQVGLIIAGLSLGTAYSHAGGLYHIVTHAIFKTALFMGAGAIMRAYGTRDMPQIRGVLKKMPITSFSTSLAILGIIGAPFFSGSVSKYFIMHDAGLIVTVIFIVINLGTIMIFVKYASMFFGNAHDGFISKRTDWWQQSPIFVLGLLCLVLGVLGDRAILLFLGVDISIDFIGYLQKIVIFAGSLVFGYVVFRRWLQQSVWLSRVGRLELGFRGMCGAIGVFFAIVVLVGMVN